MTRRLRILSRHVQASDLCNLTQATHDCYLATDAARATHHSGRNGYGATRPPPLVDLMHRVLRDPVLHTLGRKFAARGHASCREQALPAAGHAVP